MNYKTICDKCKRELPSGVGFCPYCWMEPINERLDKIEERLNKLDYTVVFRHPKLGGR